MVICERCGGEGTDSPCWECVEEMQYANDGTFFVDNTTFNPNSALLVVADTWERLRGCDVERLVCDVAGKDHAPEMIEAIKKNRGDLLPEATKAWNYLRGDA